jgi:hypothetical protein
VWLWGLKLLGVSLDGVLEMADRTRVYEVRSAGLSLAWFVGTRVLFLGRAWMCFVTSWTSTGAFREVLLMCVSFIELSQHGL